MKPKDSILRLSLIAAVLTLLAMMFTGCKSLDSLIIHPLKKLHEIRSAYVRPAINLAYLCLGLCMLMVSVSCSTQFTELPGGQRVVNNNLFSSGMIHIKDGEVLMAGNSEKAAEVLGKYGGALINGKLIDTGIGALKSVGNNAVDAIK